MMFNRNLLLIFTAMFVAMVACSQDKPQRYNVLFIAVDDLNDWTGFLGGHPQAQTPNMDKLAQKGINFTHAYCAAPVCNPSRAAIMTGIRPSSSGVYGNTNFMRDSPVLKEIQTLPQYLSANGYYTMAKGKIFHSPNGVWADPQSWDLYEPVNGGFGKVQKANGFMANGMPVKSIDQNFEWGPTDARFEETLDFKTAEWASVKLIEAYKKPFFLACGFAKPHLPWFVPQEFFDKYKVEEMILPEVNEDDFNDIPVVAGKNTKDYFTIKKYGKQKEVIQAYLACVNYVDSCVGVVLDALERSQYRNNTIIVLWGDNGWHLGEKLRYKKATLWEEACRVPLIIYIPDNKVAMCSRPVNLIDLYPTIVELCGLPPNNLNQGKSIAPLLYNPSLNWGLPTLTTMGYARHTLRDEKWRYTKYQDGSEIPLISNDSDWNTTNVGACCSYNYQKSNAYFI